MISRLLEGMALRLILTAAVIFGVLLSSAVRADPGLGSAGVNFETLEGNLRWEDGIAADQGHAVLQLPFPEDKVPKVLKWSWIGAGQVWAAVEYRDNNVIYYVMAGSNPPQVQRATCIDQNGVPRVMVPKMLELPQGNVAVDVLEDYRRYCGKKEAGVKSVRFGVTAAGRTEIRDFEVPEYSRIRTAAGGAVPADLQKGTYLKVRIPQGNDGDFYLVRGLEFPVEVGIRSLSEGKAGGSLTVTLPETVNVTGYDAQKIKLVDGRTLVMPLQMGPGYAEDTLVFSAVASGPGKILVQARLNGETETLERNIACPDLEFIRNNLRLLDEGVYPFRLQSHKLTIKKELKNYIKIREDVVSSFHRLFGSEESFDEPAGIICGALENSTGFNLPLHIKFSAVDKNGMDIPYFRGEHIRREEGREAPVPETVTGIAGGDTRDFKMPVYADIYSVKPGNYSGVLKVSLFGANADIITREFSFTVQKESQVKIISCALAVLLSLISVLLLAFNHKRWVRGLKTGEIILIALFAAVKFSIVDIPWFVFGDITRAVFGPLGPFMHIFTGIFWDIINAMFVVALVLLVPKPGVVIISSLVRIILQGVAFGTFNPITILLMLSYSALADILLYATGFTSGKRPFSESLKVFAMLAVIFAVQHIYSTYTFYYIWMYMYRLYYPDWYINVNALVSAVYSALGAVLGVYLGNKLKKVMD